MKINNRLYCPKCGKAWDGIQCTNCGYPKSIITKNILSILAFSIIAFIACMGCEKSDKLTPNSDITYLFTDEAFLAYLLDHHDTNEDGKITVAEAEAITKIDIKRSYMVYDLKGIEFCTNLLELSCRNNSLTYLDVSKNTALTHLNCDQNVLLSLNVLGCTELAMLSCNKNALDTIDVSSCAKLWYFNCNSNVITSLDLSKCAAMSFLFCIPMESLHTVYFKTGTYIYGVTHYRTTHYIPTHTAIVYVD